jgi:hypothetical protein
MSNRREFLMRSALLGAGLSLPSTSVAAQPQPATQPQAGDDPPDLVLTNGRIATMDATDVARASHGHQAAGPSLGLQ